MHRHAARVFFFFFNDTATTEIYTLSLHDALPISFLQPIEFHHPQAGGSVRKGEPDTVRPRPAPVRAPVATPPPAPVRVPRRDTTAVRRGASPPPPPERGGGGEKGESWWGRVP